MIKVETMHVVQRIDDYSSILSSPYHHEFHEETGKHQTRPSEPNGVKDIFLGKSENHRRNVQLLILSIE